jgi:UDP-N-acetylmuramate--alanine ligase
MESAKKYANLLNLEKITAIWQPHKYSRTVDNLEGFVECFKGVDELIIMPVWSAGESKREINFVEEFKKYNPQFITKLTRVGDFIDLDNSKKLDHGLVIGFGAGDITYQLRGA